MVLLKSVSSCQKAEGECQCTSTSQEHCYALPAVMVLDTAEEQRGCTSLSCRHNFLFFAAQLLTSSATLLGFWVSDTGLAIRYWRVVWGSSSAHFLVRHVLAHEEKCVTVCSCQAMARTFWTECPGKAIVRSAFMWTKKASLRRVTSSDSAKLGLHHLPLRGKVSKCVPSVAKAGVSKLHSKGRMLCCCAETLKTLSQANRVAWAEICYWINQRKLCYSVLVLPPTQWKANRFFKNKLLH